VYPLRSQNFCNWQPSTPMSQQQSLEDLADMMGGNIRTRRDRIAGETFIADVNASTTLSLQLFKKKRLAVYAGLFW
jgi:hypothetical protein